MHISIRTEFRQAERFYRHLGKTAVPKAAARAINKTLQGLRTDGARAIRKAHPGGPKIGEIKQELKLYKANFRQLRGVIYVTGRPMSLLRFGATQLKSGASARFGRNRKGVIRYHGKPAFILASKGGEVFVPRSGGGIRRFRGPSMPGMFRAQLPEFKRSVRERWPKEMERSMKFEIQRAARAARTL